MNTAAHGERATARSAVAGTALGSWRCAAMSIGGWWLSLIARSERLLRDYYFSVGSPASFQPMMPLA